MPWTGYLQPQPKSLLPKIKSKARPAALRVRSLRILATNETRIVDESASLGGVPGDGFETYPVSSDYTHGAGAGAKRGASRRNAE
jgi:hypothetical protein